MTHVDNKPKPQGVHMFVYEATSAGEPNFDVFIVGAQKEKWFKIQL